MRNRISLGALVVGCIACGAGDGDNALLHLAEEPAGDNCPEGGTRIDAGRDRNGNSVLDASEVQTTSYVCSGSTGRPGEHGSDGANGQDGDNGQNGNDGQNGQDGDNGQDGSDGQDGQDGSDGQNGEDAAQVLIALSFEPAGAHCPAGGQRVDTGVDVDRDQRLDPEEITQTAYVCNGPGRGVAGFRLIAQFTAPGGPIAEIVAASPDGNQLAYTSSTANTVGFLDITDPAAPRPLGVVSVAQTVSHGGGQPTSVAITPDGRYAVVAVRDPDAPIVRADPGALVFIDLATRTIAGQVAVGVGPDSVRISPDGRLAVIAIEDEEDPDGNDVAQARPGSVQIVTINHAAPSASAVATVALAPTVGNLRADPQPEYVDITADSRTAIVSLQENNAIAVIDLPSATVIRYLDAGTSVHARADLVADGEIALTTSFVGQLQPDAVCLLGDGRHFVTANEGDTPNFPAFAPGVWAGGRGFSVFRITGERVFDSGDAAEAFALRAGAYPEDRSADRGVEIEGCATGRFGGAEYAFFTLERAAALLVADVSAPDAPVLTQLLGAPMRPESALAITRRGLVVVGGEGDEVGGGVWIYQAVSDASEAGAGPDIYDARSPAGPFSALGALAYEPSTGLLVATPDNAFPAQRLWWFAIDHADRRMTLVRELRLRDHTGAPLTGYDPEGLAVNPAGGYVIASEGVARNGLGPVPGPDDCVGSVRSNRLLFFDASGKLDPGYDGDGIVDLPCGTAPGAFDWRTLTANGFEGVAMIDTTPGAPGGLQVFVAFQRGLTGEGQDARIGRYDVTAGTWTFWFYPLAPNPGGDAGNTFLSELIHVDGDRFAVIERDQGWAGAAGNKTIRTFRLASGTAGDRSDPVEKTTAVDLLARAFRFDQEKIEGLALGGGALWVTNDNDGGLAPTFFARLDPALLDAPPTTTEPEPEPEPQPQPGPSPVVLNEIRTQGADFIELFNRSDTAVDLTGWRFIDGDPAHAPLVLPLGTTIAPHGYLLIPGDSSSATLRLPWGLGDSDEAHLIRPDGSPADDHIWTVHQATASRCPDGNGAFVATPGSGTPGTANVCP